MQGYVVIRSNNLNAISGLHRHHEQTRFYAQKSWPADSNLRINILLKNPPLIETEETALTLVKAQKILFQLHYATDRAHNEPLGLFCVFWPSTRVQ